MYDLKSAGFLWRLSLAALLREIGLNPIMADPKVWIRAAISLDGYKYNEMLLVYVNYIMIISHLGDELDKQIFGFIISMKGVKVHIRGT